MPRVSRYRGYLFGRQDNGENQTYISCCTWYCHQAALMPRKSREIFEILCRRGLTFGRGFNEAPLRCLACDNVARVLQEVHTRWQATRGFRLFKPPIHLGDQWHNMEADAAFFNRKCQACQINSNRIHAPTIKLHRLSTP